jgi:hypothetical protein
VVLTWVRYLEVGQLEPNGRRTPMEKLPGAGGDSAEGRELAESHPTSPRVRTPPQIEVRKVLGTTADRNPRTGRRAALSRGNHRGGAGAIPDRCQRQGGRQGAAARAGPATVTARPANCGGPLSRSRPAVAGARGHAGSFAVAKARFPRGRGQRGCICRGNHYPSVAFPAPRDRLPPLTGR